MQTYRLRNHLFHIFKILSIQLFHTDFLGAKQYQNTLILLICIDQINYRKSMGKPLYMNYVRRIKTLSHKPKFYTLKLKNKNSLSLGLCYFLNLI